MEIAMNDLDLYRLCHNYFKYDDGKLIRIKKVASRGIKGQEAGYIAKNGYRLVSVNYKRLYEHRIIFLMHHKYLPKFIDHIDKNPTNNRIDNLRECTLSQNGFNSSAKIGGTSKFKGVNWLKPNRKWRARVKHNKKEIHLGLFDDPIEGAKAYDKYIIENVSEFGVTNKSLGLY